MILHELVILSIAIAVGIHAAPTADDNLVVIHTESLGTNGTLTYYGEANPSQRERSADSLEARACASRTLHCSGSHLADSNLCRVLIRSLKENSGWAGPSPRSICLSKSGQCCISWATNVDEFPQGDLVSAANAVLGKCDDSLVSAVSGLARNVKLNGRCTTQCLSNRPTGCTN